VVVRVVAGSRLTIVVPISVPLVIVASVRVLVVVVAGVGIGAGVLLNASAVGGVLAVVSLVVAALITFVAHVASELLTNVFELLILMVSTTVIALRYIVACGSAASTPHFQILQSIILITITGLYRWTLIILG